MQAPVKVEAAQRPTVDPRALWDRMDALGYSQNETARRAGISPGYLSQIMNGKRTPSGDVLRRLHEVAVRAVAGGTGGSRGAQGAWAGRRADATAWSVQGAGGPGGGTIRTGGRVPWGAEVEYAYRAGYDSRGGVSVNHLVDERGCSALLKRGEPGDV